uniref:Uncharacterized protein n=1 Tax=Anabas testudineus TaxID=64144 RepID=A0A7N6AKT3_ANATE
MGGSESCEEEVGVASRQVMKCDVLHSRNSTVTVLFFSVVPWVSPALLPAILVLTHIRWLEPVEEPLQKMETPAASVPPSSERNGHAGMFQLAADAPSSCPHLYLGTHMGSNWEKGFTTCRGPAMQTNGCTGLPACSIVSEHRVPLPATELGGTALVTTKTV